MHGNTDDESKFFGETFTKGQVCRGLITSVHDSGVLVDLNGTQGFISVPDLSWERDKFPSELVREGDEIVAVVLQVDPRSQVRLSRKALEPNPLWRFARTSFGHVLRGHISGIAPIGIFVSVGDGIAGLVPAAELARAHIHSEAAKVGDEMMVQIAAINIESGKVELRLPAEQEVEGV